MLLTILVSQSRILVKSNVSDRVFSYILKSTVFALVALEKKATSAFKKKNYFDSRIESICKMKRNFKLLVLSSPLIWPHGGENMAMVKFHKTNAVYCF